MIGNYKDNRGGYFVVEKYKHDDNKLWCILGSLVVSRDIRKELGLAISSDNTYIWWIAKGKGVILGFCAVSLGKEVATLRHAYIFKNFRNKGIYGFLLKERIEFIETRRNIRKITATATEHSKPILDKIGFHEISKRGKYSTMRLLLKKTQGK